MTTFTATQAAEVCAVSVRTVQRKMSQLEAHGAYKDAAGQWHIPVAALTAVGLSPGRPKAPDSGGDNTPDNSERQPDTVTATLSQLREENAQLLRRTEVAEAIAEERLRTIDALTSSVRALEAAVTRPQLTAPAEQATRSVDHAHEQPRRRHRRTMREWWHSRARTHAHE